MYLLRYQFFFILEKVTDMLLGGPLAPASSIAAISLSVRSAAIQIC